MREASCHRRCITVVIVALCVAGCAQVWTFPVVSKARAVHTETHDLHVGLVSTQIRIWFFEDAEHISLVRVVGYGTELPCMLATADLTKALQDPAIDGFLTFGAGELRARQQTEAGRRGFDVAARAL